MANSVSDDERIFLETETGQTGSLSDLRHAYYSDPVTGSGLSPVAHYSVTDHKWRYLRDAPETVDATGETVMDLEMEFLANQVPPLTGSIQDRRKGYFE